jgi:hypothetical protein
MIKIIKISANFFLAITLLFSIQTSAMQSVNLPHKNIIVQKEGTKAIFKDVAVFGEPGQPALPYYSVTFLLPAQSDLHKCTVRLEHLTEKELPGEYDIDGALPPLVDSLVWPSDKNIINGKDMAIYSKNSFFPESNIGNIARGAMRQFKLVTVTIVPVKYNPQTRKLKIITGGQLVVYDISNMMTQPPAPTSATAQVVNTSTAEKIRSLVINYDKVAPTYNIASAKSTAATTTTNANGVYTIITTNAIANASLQLQFFVQSKRNRGFDVQVVTESTWGGGRGDVAANNIRNWLRANYLTKGISYVLLIGNPVTDTGNVPMKMTWPRSHETQYDREAPTDYYYSELSGNWDIDNDGLAGERIGDFDQSGGPDCFGEVAVGRIPVYRSINELDRILAKTVSYENERGPSINWRTNMLIPIKPLDPLTIGDNLGEAIAISALDTVGWKKFRIYELNNHTDPEALPCSHSTVLNTWIKGAYGLTTWLTHGSAISAEGIMDSYSAKYLNNQYPSITFHGSCTNAHPETEDNLCYSLLKNGAITTIGATRQSWYRRGENYFDNTSTVTSMAYNCALHIIKNGRTVGDALTLVRAGNMNPIWANWLVMNIYGDPSLSVYTSADNIFTAGTIPSQKIFASESFDPIFLNSYVYNSKYSSSQIQWTVSGNIHLDIQISASNRATITSRDTNWTGKENVMFIATNPEGVSKTIPVLFECMSGSIHYISDLQWVNATAGLGLILRDHGINGNPLTIGGKTFAKGICARAPSEITYALNGAYDKFITSYGLDDEAQGLVIFKVFGDTNCIFTSNKISSGEIGNVELIVKPYRTLRLVVTDAGNGSYPNYADWADSRFISNTITGNLNTITVRIKPVVKEGCLNPDWNNSTVYIEGNKCSYNNQNFRSRWWNQGTVPRITTDPSFPWEYIDDCPGKSEFTYGRASVNGSMYLESGSNKTIYFYPDLLSDAMGGRYYVISELIVDGTRVSPINKNSYTFKNINSDHTLEVQFDSFLSNSYGNIYGDPTYKSLVYAVHYDSYNREVPIAAFAGPGYQFDRWTSSGGNATITNPASALTTAILHGGTIYFTANFKPYSGPEYNLTVSPQNVLTSADIIFTVNNQDQAGKNGSVDIFNAAEQIITIPVTIALGTNKITHDLSSLAAGTYTVRLLIDGSEVDNCTFIKSGPHNWNLSVSPSSFRANAMISFSAESSYVNNQVQFQLNRIYDETPQRDQIETFYRNVSSGINSFNRELWNYLPIGYYEISIYNNSTAQHLASFTFEKLSNPIDFQLSASPVNANTSVTISFNNPNPFITGNAAAFVFTAPNGSMFSKSISIQNGINSFVQYISGNYYPDGQYRVIMLFEDQPVDTTTFTKVSSDHSVRASVTDINFGNLNTGTTKTVTFTLTNIGNEPALISSITSSNPVFSFIGNTPICINAGESANVTVRYVPESAGPHTGTLTITNAPNSQIQELNIDLAGTGISATASFDVLLKADAKPTDNNCQPIITIKNTGNLNVTLSDYTIEYYTYDPTITAQNIAADIYYCSMSNSNATGSVSKLSQVYGSGSQRADTKTSVNFSAGTLTPNQSVQINLGIHSKDWQYMFNENDDWSYRVDAGNKGTWVVIRNKTTNAVIFGNQPQ